MKSFAAFLALSCVALARGQVMPLGSQGAGLGSGSLGAGASNVRFNTVAQGQDGPTGPGFFVLENATQWASYWKENHGGEVPKTDPGFFANWRFVAIHLGGRPSGGYGVGVASMLRTWQNMNLAKVTAIETVPPRGARVERGATSPWIVLRVERGAFGLSLQTKKVEGFASNVTDVSGATVVKSGGATVVIGGGSVATGCDHCDHCGRGTCHCERGRKGCDCKGH